MSEIKPPPLRNDCFALPPGVDWTPVDEAKLLLKKALSAVVSSGARIPVEDGFDRILSSKVDAVRSNPSGSTRRLTVLASQGPLLKSQVMKLATVGLRCAFRSCALRASGTNPNRRDSPRWSGHCRS